MNLEKYPCMLFRTLKTKQEGITIGPSCNYSFGNMNFEESKLKTWSTALFRITMTPNLNNFFNSSVASIQSAPSELSLTLHPL